MNQNFWENNPLISSMPPEKLKFLMNFANAKKPASGPEMMPFLLSFLNSAKSQNIQFSANETNTLLDVIKQNMSPDEAAKADKIIKMMKSNH